MKEITAREEKILNEFFENNEFVEPKTGAIDGNYMIDDFNEARAILKGNSNYKCFTLVDADDEEAWIVDGWHIVNRIGYFITKSDATIPEEGIRYW